MPRNSTGRGSRRATASSAARTRQVHCFAVRFARPQAGLDGTVPAPLMRWSRGQAGACRPRVDRTASGERRGNKHAVRGRIGWPRLACRLRAAPARRSRGNGAVAPNLLGKAAQESNLPTAGLRRLTGFEDRCCCFVRVRSPADSLCQRGARLRTPILASVGCVGLRCPARCPIACAEPPVAPFAVAPDSSIYKQKVARSSRARPSSRLRIAKENRAR